MSISSIDYDRLTETEALDILKNDFDKREVESWENRNHIRCAVDVLYYCDAYGDLEDAILLQAFDKTLPTTAHKGLLDSGRDIFEAVNCNEIETEYCPSCDSEMWEIEIREGRGYNSRTYLDEYGNMDEDVTHVADPGGLEYWNADPDEDHAPFLCAGCSHDVWYDHPRKLSDSGSVVVHYGETDEISAFSVAGNIVRWDYECRLGFRNNRNWTDLWGLPGSNDTDVPEAFAKNDKKAFFREHGWEHIENEYVRERCEASTILRKSAAKKAYRTIAEEWAEGNETHPDLDFTYVIDFDNLFSPRFWVPEENYEELIGELVDLVDRRV